ncbi:hypothetical protein BDV96DRAFT_653647 [Lophiotrema nucula]|uniref:Uncharacterized protein n=1 Tax=Lophiotrema nucula TaxID=690887 RepID=A0A6A5YKQ0_9PLEO|nr:hypothetical protein BDV96DRAFT_653647 [Lophiotrema nucula]
MPVAFKLPPGFKFDFRIPPGTPVLENGTPVLFGPPNPDRPPFEERDDCPLKKQTKQYPTSFDQAYDTDATKAFWAAITKWQQRGELHLQLLKPIQEECRNQLEEAKATNRHTDTKVWESRLTKADHMLLSIYGRLDVLVSSARQFFRLLSMLSIGLLEAQAGQQEGHRCVHDTCSRLLEEQRILGHIQDALMAVMPGLLPNYNPILAQRLTKKIMKDYPDMLTRIKEHEKAVGSQWATRFGLEYFKVAKIWEAGDFPDAWPFVHN